MKFYSATLLGVQPIPVEIEIDLSPGLPFFQIVGLPDEVLRESKTRVKSAILQSGFDFPYDRRLVLNLAPSKLKKEGSSFELALAARILYASGQIDVPDFNILFLGELALDGSIKPVDDIEALAFAAQMTEVKLIVVPEAVRQNIKLDLPVIGLKHLKDLSEKNWWDKKTESFFKKNSVISEKNVDYNSKSFEDFIFSEFWAWHLKLAAIGKLHYFLCGPPGCGKTFFAESLKSLRERIDRKIDDPLNSILNCVFKRNVGEIPWSAPHHSISEAGLVGGGKPPKPGAVTRSHFGVLFLDELLEFSPQSLDALREPLEKGVVEIARAGCQVKFPCRFQLVAATNPCRCGFWGHTSEGCTCSKANRRRYQFKVSGPLMDRFDVKLFCKLPLGNEKKIKGGEIIKSAREVLKFMSKENGGWTKEARDYLNHEFGGAIKNHRVFKKVQTMAPLIAAMDFQRNVECSHVSKALELQTFSFGETPG